jgi:AcrR family transcriptional regulator
MFLRGCDDPIGVAYRDIVSLVESSCRRAGALYSAAVPKLWTATIAAHRDEVRGAILDTTAALVAESGLRSATMSRIAERTGIGRATLYKYFPDVSAVLLAWHERQISRHLEQLAVVRNQAESARERLEAVLGGYALMAHRSRGHQDAELTSFLHQDEQVPRAEKQLRDMVGELLADTAREGEVRADVPPRELASYCLHALAAASSCPSVTAVRRLVKVTLAGLRP